MTIVTHDGIEHPVKADTAIVIMTGTVGYQLPTSTPCDRLLNYLPIRSIKVIKP